MYQGLLHLHNAMRWVILLLIAVAILKAIAGLAYNKRFTNGDRKVGLLLMISAHITLLIGLYQWIAGPWGLKLIRNAGMSAVMSNPIYRFWAVEHLTGMLVAIVLITIGRGVSKKNITDRLKHRRTFWFYLAALVIIIATVPWPSRVGIGRPLVPGMHRSAAADVQ